MSKDVYARLCVIMAKRGGMYPGMDIPEFYELVQELFTPQQAAISNDLPRGFNSADVIAAAVGQSLDEVAPALEEMADKGLCMSIKKGDTMRYAGPPFVPGIFEYQFMRGTDTEKDRKLARLIRNYKEAVNKQSKPQPDRFPAMRVITVNRTIKAGNTIHTYDQVKQYIENMEPLAVSTCYCRHQAKLIDASSHCGKPDDVCLQFGYGPSSLLIAIWGARLIKTRHCQFWIGPRKRGLCIAPTIARKLIFCATVAPVTALFSKMRWHTPSPGWRLTQDSCRYGILSSVPPAKPASSAVPWKP